MNPIDFKVEDFLSSEDNAQVINAINEEALTGSELVDNLILLKLVDKPTIQRVLKERYNMVFAWLRVDTTPPQFKQIAKKHNVVLELREVPNKNDPEKPIIAVVVYVPLGVVLDTATLQIDIPNYPISVRYIADCNYRLLGNGLPENLLSFSVAPYRPILVYKVLVLDCIRRAGTNMHIESVYEKKQPHHRIGYRVKREMVPAPFQIDFEMFRSIMQTVVGKLTPASAMDIDSPCGITTSVGDVFHDGECDVRLTGMRVDAGYYLDTAIQLTNTTAMTLDELGFPNEDVNLIRELAKKRTGLTLITGAQRSGKNTTIFAMLNEVKREPIQILEYSNPIENRMEFSQVNYKGDLDNLRHLLRLSKKQDVDIVVINEMPDNSIAFAVRDLVNSSIGVITTTHLDRVWHLPGKLREFFGEDYKTIVSQLNVVINQKMFRRWKGPGLQKRALVKEHGPFEMAAYQAGVRQYFVPEDMSKMTLELQPLTEIIVMTDAIKSSMLAFDETAKAQQMLELNIRQQHATLENKVAAYINNGLMSLEEFRKI